MKNFIRKTPILNAPAQFIYSIFVAPFQSFHGSKDYWEQRYRKGNTSGYGSYNELAEFKAHTLNHFVEEQQVETIIEYGSGDGNQLTLSKYPSYIGFDVSDDAISLCKRLFADDHTKTFKLVEAYTDETAQLTLSLDVIYHLIEDEVFCAYMTRLFASSTKFVVIYSSDTDKQDRFQAPHVKHRHFSIWIEQNQPDWTLVQHIPNKHSLANQKPYPDFYIYQKT